MIYQSLADPFYSKGENTAISGDPATSKSATCLCVTVEQSGS
ncbi:hypothetical protein HanRHA438_Chr15g0722281 [Helianthus annuus]|nr:hypothetical protein HanRHA438_Chr15g0722281 [Helianthus annuus]